MPADDKPFQALGKAAASGLWEVVKISLAIGAVLLGVRAVGCAFLGH